MLAKRLATIEPLVFTVLVLVALVSPVFMRMNGYSAISAIPSNILLIALIMGWSLSILQVATRAAPAAEPGAKALLWLGLAIGVVMIANVVLGAVGIGTGPSLFIAAGLYFLFLWRVAGALERAAAGSLEVGIGRIAATFLLLWINVVGVWLLRRKILAVAEAA